MKCRSFILPGLQWFGVINQTRETVFHRDVQTWRRELKIRLEAKYIFDEIRGVWMADETLSRVFDISSQSKQKLGSKRRNKIVKFYLHFNRKTGYPHLLHACDILGFYLQVELLMSLRSSSQNSRRRPFKMSGQDSRSWKVLANEKSDHRV